MDALSVAEMLVARGVDWRRAKGFVQATQMFVVPHVSPSLTSKKWAAGRDSFVASLVAAHVQRSEAEAIFEAMGHLLVPAAEAAKMARQRRSLWE